MVGAYLFVAHSITYRPERIGVDRVQGSLVVQFADRRADRCPDVLARVGNAVDKFLCLSVRAHIGDSRSRTLRMSGALAKTSYDASAQVTRTWTLLSSLLPSQAFHAAG